MGQPLRLSLIRVTDVRRITPHMARITFGGDDLAHFTHVAPDQQVKLFFPRPGQLLPRVPEPNPDGDVNRWYQSYLAMPEPERPWMRSYTIRAHHPDRNEIDIDFVLHGDSGPASRWGQSAKPGDTLGMFGPAPSHYRRVGDPDWRLLAGDETALPAIGALLEALPEGARAVVYAEVADAAEEQRFDTRGEVTVHWVHRGDVPAGRSDVLVRAVRAAEFPSGSVFAWLAGESGTVRALRRHLVEERGVDKKAIAFTGYWRLNLTQDDAPTEEDAAEAQERLAEAQAMETAERAVD